MYHAVFCLALLDCILTEVDRVLPFWFDNIGPCAGALPRPRLCNILYACTLGSAIELPEVLRNTARNKAYYAVVWIAIFWPEYRIL